MRLHRLRLLLVTMVVVTSLGAVPPGEVAAPAPELTASVPVAPGLQRETYRFQGSSGGVDVQVLRFEADDPRLAVRPELGDGRIPGLEATHEATRRLGQSAVAAVNGSFFRWTARPVGDPRGLMVADGEYVSEPERGWGGSWRGAFGIAEGGTPVFGNPDFTGRIVLPGPCGRTRPICELPIGGVNRHPRLVPPTTPSKREMTVLSPVFGPRTGTPPGTVEVTFRDYDLRPTGDRDPRPTGDRDPRPTGDRDPRPTGDRDPRPTGDAEVTVEAIGSGGDVPIPGEGAVLAATGSMGTELRKQLQPGSTVTLDFGIAEAWRDVEQALGGGPTILRDGERTPPSQWRAEGFDPAGHSEARHPRTIVGRAPGDVVLLVTVDGRTDRSGGLSMADTQDLMLHLGSTHAVHLDGGGSSTMVVDDRIVNDPCCDAAGYRRVATNLIVHSDVATPDVERVGTHDPYETAAAVARRGWPDGADTVVLASGRDDPGGLAGVPLAHRYGAPLLLTQPDRLPPVTVDALRALAPRRVLVIGGRVAVADAVTARLEQEGFGIRRFGGADPLATAAVIARHLGTPGRTAFLVSAPAWPQAVSAAAPAALANAPLLFTHRRKLPPVTAAALERLGVRDVVLAGGPAAISPAVEHTLVQRGLRIRRLAGTTRYGTSAQLVAWSRERGDVEGRAVVLASGRRFAEALVAGSYGARAARPVVLVDSTTLGRSAATRDWLRRQDLGAATIVGDRSVVGTYVAVEVQRLLEP